MRFAGKSDAEALDPSSFSLSEPDLSSSLPELELSSSLLELELENCSAMLGLTEPKSSITKQ